MLSQEVKIYPYLFVPFASLGSIFQQWKRKLMLMFKFHGKHCKLHLAVRHQEHYKFNFPNSQWLLYYILWNLFIESPSHSQVFIEQLIWTRHSELKHSPCLQDVRIQEWRWKCGQCNGSIRESGLEAGLCRPSCWVGTLPLSLLTLSVVQQSHL